MTKISVSYSSLLVVVAALAYPTYVANFKLPFHLGSSALEEQFEGLTMWGGPASPKVKILSYDPFIAHISDFVTASECQYLKELGKPMMIRSTVLLANGTRVEHEARTSSTAYLPRDDPVVKAITARAAEFQGFVPEADVDTQITSYQPGQQYTAHYDWFTEPGRQSNRLSTFFAILETDCENCGTRFPNVLVDWALKDSRWCEVVDCSQEVLTSKNVVGSAIFWRNLDSHGQGRKDTLHAGLPAVNGTKVGLNIWTEVNLSQFEKSKRGHSDQIVLRP